MNVKNLFLFLDGPVETSVAVRCPLQMTLVGGVDVGGIKLHLLQCWFIDSSNNTTL